MKDLLEKLLNEEDFEDIFQPASDEELSKIGMPGIRVLMDIFYDAFGEPSNLRKLSELISKALLKEMHSDLEDDEIAEDVSRWQTSPPEFVEEVFDLLSHQLELN